MKSLRRRALAKAYNCKYHWSNRNNMWSVRTISGTYGASSYGKLTDQDFIERLKWYKESDWGISRPKRV